MCPNQMFNFMQELKPKTGYSEKKKMLLSPSQLLAIQDNKKKRLYSMRKKNIST